MRAASAVLIPNESSPPRVRSVRRSCARSSTCALGARTATSRWSAISSLRTVPARLASFLCTLVARRPARGEDARNLVRDLTTETVAGRLGTVREEISRGLAYLEREGALKVSPDLIEVVNVERLEEIAFGSKKG